MKSILFNSRVLTILAVYAFGGYMLTSCVDKDTDYSRPDNGSTPNSFAFNTTQEVQLNVKYELPEYSKNEDYEVKFEVYFENPFKTEEGLLVKNKDVKPKLTRMTDGKGIYSGKEVIPGYLLNEGEDVYIYTSSIGVPQLYKTTVSGNSIQADINWDTMYDFDPMPQTRAESNYSIPAGFDKLGDWDIKGRPEYLITDGALELSKSLLKSINKTIPEGGTCTKYRQEVDFEIKESANVKVRFIGGTSTAASAFGYYCYKANENNDIELEAIKKAKKYIVFPNTKTGVGIKGGECVELHYIDENGVDQGSAFPAGVKIGWFISNNAFKNGNIGNGLRMFYSTQRMNGDQRKHTAAFKVGDFIVLSFEDWTDKDYNDVMFNIWSNPIKAIDTPEIPPVDPIEPEDNNSVAYKMTYKGIVAFEDNWPSKGDYDLNDVVVKYNSVLSYNIKNEVLSTEDTFTAYWSGAKYINSFIYQLNTERTNVESSMEMDQDLSLATIPVFMDMKEATGNNSKTTEMTINNKFKTPIDHEVFGVAPYNPFISVYKSTNYNRTEVHLVNYKPTEKAKMDLFNTEMDMSDIAKGIYYVSDSKYPFAIHLSDINKYSTTESKSVDTAYPRFVSWVESNGTKDKDWYMK